MRCWGWGRGEELFLAMKAGADRFIKDYRTAFQKVLSPTVGSQNSCSQLLLGPTLFAQLTPLPPCQVGHIISSRLWSKQCLSVTKQPIDFMPLRKCSLSSLWSLELPPFPRNNLSCVLSSDCLLWTPLCRLYWSRPPLSSCGRLVSQNSRWT